MTFNPDQDWQQFKDVFHKKSNIDLNAYKPAQMQRRITNFMNRRGCSKYMDFYGLIVRDEALYREFIDFLTINVTEFFRTPNKFEDLKVKIFPELLKKNSRLNIWSAGCSTGAEPYTMAIMLDQLTPGVKHKILATDIDNNMLANARQGIYVEGELKNVSPADLKKYFTKLADGRFQVNPDIRQRVDFRFHNMLRDRFDSNFDLIVCRNVVIYFTEEAKNELYRRFFESLRPGGFLFVGGTEAILNARELGYSNYLPFFYQRPAS
ncbi:MAG: protein-glutamate O-methyltransferase CheR [Negativicutes bacterium]|nr:protein-glutamate O-methyltransferase CheR [Negativicutes bacterium]